MTPAASFDWDLFLGGAKERPYNSTYAPFSWRGWWDFGTGALGDMACHTANMAYRALKLGAPTSVEVVYSSGISPESPPKSSQLKFTFAERGPGYPALTFHWYDGGKLPPAELVKGLKLPSSGSLLVGTKGMLYSPNDYGAQYKLLPERKLQGIQAAAADDRSFARPLQRVDRRLQGGHGCVLELRYRGSVHGICPARQRRLAYWQDDSVG